MCQWVQFTAGAVFVASFVCAVVFRVLAHGNLSDVGREELTYKGAVDRFLLVSRFFVRRPDAFTPTGQRYRSIGIAAVFCALISVMTLIGACR